ncbi:MAG: asparagine synthase (glutamine-hydrolyzing) [Candidatus Binatia bacterium]
MCGITGILNYDFSERVDPRVVGRMCDVIAHRGPDDEGIFVNGPVGLGMRRLSIIDVHGGHQPMFNEDGSLCIVFNGEIYNHREIREQMIARGHNYATQSDTESILHLYEELGVHCVQQLRGMFAFAIWDSRNHKLFMARDRVGIKPLFYRVDGDRLIFASEIKSILEHPQVRREMDWQALDTYFSLSYITGSRTIFRGISRLLPGHYLLCENGRIRMEKYWDLFHRPNRKAKMEDLCAEFLYLLREAIELHLISDVPLGAFLSGGIDSSTLVALMSERMTEPVKTFTIGFGGTVGDYEDERPFAQIIADRYKTSHREMEVLPNLEGLVEKIVTAFDEPFADDSTIPTYYVSKLAREHVKVALSGLGGDELLGGYERYLGFSLSESYVRIPQWLHQWVISPVVEGLPDSRNGSDAINHLKRFIRCANLPPAQRYFDYRVLLDRIQRTALFADDLHNEMRWPGVEEECSQYFHSPNAADPLDRIMYQDVKVYLPDDILANTDRISMGQSLEVRVPFLDHKLMEFCATMPATLKIKGLQKKYLFKKAVAHLVPIEILDKKKQGFAGPMALWLRHELKEYARDMLSEANLRTHGYFKPQSVTAILDEHFSRRKRHDTLIWALLNFQVWYELYMGQRVGSGR